MLNEPIEETYFNWLYTKVAFIDNPTPTLTYYNLLQALHSTEFVILMEGDDNRAVDGLDLRTEFLREMMLHPDLPEMSRNIPCSILEMLIAFSRRTNFDIEEKSPKEWFWIFLDNLGIADLNDARPNIVERIYGTLERFVWRQYNFSGKGGGLFPLRHPKEDQTKVELYYQFCAWLEEHQELHI